MCSARARHFDGLRHGLAVTGFGRQSGRRGWVAAACLGVLLLAAVPRPAEAQMFGRRAPTRGAVACLQAIDQAADDSARREAVASFLVALPGEVPASAWGTPFDLGPYRITFARPARGTTSLWEPTYFDEYVDPARVGTRQLRTRVVTEGVGVPMVGLRQWSPERAAAEPFLPEVGYSCAVTASVEFPSSRGSQREVLIKLIHPANTDAPLAADYSAALEVLLDALPGYDIGRRGLFRPMERGTGARLIMLAPYQPDKIPVVFAHGVDSAARTWQDAFNELQADPVIRRRYQFWFFQYPTGNPVPFSAALMREWLESVRAHYDPKGRSPSFNRMVIIGHSMGGLLARLMVTEPGGEFWRPRSGIHFDQLDMDDADRDILRRSLFFHRLPYVKRVVFISTPHRGSMLAQRAVGQMTQRLIHVPEEAAALPSRILARNRRLFGDRLQEHDVTLPTGIDNLKPNNSFVLTLQDLPILAPCHTIIGDRGIKVRSEPASDGVVPYWSSHVPSAESEFVVPYGHSAHQHPFAIEEMRRILRVHLDRAP